MNKTFHDLSRRAALAALPGFAASTVAAAAPPCKVVPVSRGGNPRDTRMQATRINDAAIIVAQARDADGRTRSVELLPQ